MSPRKPKNSADDEIDFMAPARAARERQAAKTPVPALSAPLTDKSFNIIKSEENNSINTGNSLTGDSATPFTRQELDFLSYRILEKQSLFKSMLLAGYEKVSRRNLERKAHNIIYRYEVWAGEAQKVFRHGGLGEVRLALTVDKLLDSKKESTQARAAELLAKILRATAPPEVPVQGVKIIINIQQAPPAGEQPFMALPPEVPGQPTDSRKRIPPPLKALQITK